MRPAVWEPMVERVEREDPKARLTCGSCAHFVRILGSAACDGWCSCWRSLPQGRSMLVHADSGACPLHRDEGPRPYGCYGRRQAR